MRAFNQPLAVTSSKDSVAQPLDMFVLLHFGFSREHNNAWHKRDTPPQQLPLWFQMPSDKGARDGNLARAFSKGPAVEKSHWELLPCLFSNCGVHPEV